MSNLNTVPRRTSERLVSIVVPTYKEAPNVPVLVEDIDRNMKTANMPYEIIIVDDDSNDGIIETVDKLTENYRVQLKVRKRQRGLSSAVIAGFAEAKGDICVVMDADLSHPPNRIPKLVEQITENDCDFVVGSRFVEGGSAHAFNVYRRLNALLSRALAKPLTKVNDPLAGFFAFRKTILADNLNPLGFKIGLELMVKCRPKRIGEVPIEFHERLYGQSKLSIKEQLAYLLHIARLYEYRFGAVSEIVKFCAVGGVGTMVDLGTTFVAKEALQIAFPIARSVGFLCGLTNNFLLNRKFTFACAHRRNVALQYMSFLGISILGFLVNWSISVYLYRTNPFFTMHYLLASFFGVLGGLVINFTGNKFITFRGSGRGNSSTDRPSSPS